MRRGAFIIWVAAVLLAAMAGAPASAAVAVEPLSSEVPGPDDAFSAPARPEPVRNAGFAQVGDGLSGMNAAGAGFARDHGLPVSDTLFFAATAAAGVALIFVAALARRRHRRRVGWGVVADRPLPFTLPGRD